MFHQKYNVKENHLLRKKEVKQFKDEVNVLFGQKFANVCEALFAKKDSILKQVWKIGDASATLYLVDQVPLFITIEAFPRDTDIDLFRLPINRILLPTIFLLLSVRLILHETQQEMFDFFQNIGLSVSCHRSTSRHIFSGAHLMIPGIVSCTDSGLSENFQSSVALIYSLRNDVPFAVGLTTHKLATNSKHGIGVYIVNCFNDLMWKHFQSFFHTKCLTFSISVNPVPKEFGEKEILPVIDGVRDESLSNDSGEQVCDASEEELPEAIEDSGPSPIVKGCHELFPDEESILKFCLCEAVKSVTLSMLPLPLSEFTAIFLKSYPLILSDSKEVSFRKTHVKKALPYFQKFPDVIEIRKIYEGNYVISNRNKDAPLLREHNSKFATFLKEIHEPRKQQLSQKNQIEKLTNSSTTLLPKIISVSELYVIENRLEQNFIAPLFKDSSALQRITQTPKLTKTNLVDNENVEKSSFDLNIFSYGLTKGQIIDALRNYINHNKLVVSSGQDSKIPLVKLNSLLAQFVRSDSSEMLITTLRELILKRFTLKHEIIWTTVVQNDSMDADSIHSRRILVNGPPPIVTIKTKKEHDNKIITIVENLDCYCFDFNTVSTFLQKEFATSCFEYSQNGKVETLKGGKKNRLHIALMGNLKVKVKNLVLTKFGIPPQYVKW